MISNLLRHFRKYMITVDHLSYSAGSIGVDGTWTPGSATTTPVRIVQPQPATSNDLQLLPEGEEAVDVQIGWSEVRFKTRYNNQDADKLVYNSETYKILQVNDRIEGDFWRFIMSRDEGQA